MKLGMVIDPSACIDCRACQAACKVENEVSPGSWRNWVRATDAEAAALGGERLYFQPGGCMHCDDPACVRACPTGASFKNPADGVVLVDRDLCIGCGYCLPACPYGARYRHAELRVADKCDFCAARRAEGRLPACVETCPNKARTFGDLDDPASPVRRLLETRQAARLFPPEDASRGTSAGAPGETFGQRMRSPNMTPGPTPGPGLLRASSRASGEGTGPNLYYLEPLGPTDWPRRPQVVPASAVWTGGVVPAVHLLAAVPVLKGLTVLRERAVRVAEAGRERPGEESGFVQRRAASAIALHWLNALAWLLLLVTGLGLIGNPELAPAGIWLPWLLRDAVGDGGTLLRLHVTLGCGWVAVLALYALLRSKDARVFLGEILSFSPRDLAWAFRESLWAPLLGRPARHGERPAFGGFYDPGQRAWALLLVVCGAAIVGSGVCLVLSKALLSDPLPAQWALPLHSFCVGLASAAALAHALGRLLGSGRSALSAMLDGRVTEEHARTRHPLWFEQLRQFRQVQRNNRP